MKRILPRVYIAVGLACVAYYLLLGLILRFDLDMSWMWLVVGGALTAVGCIGLSDRVPRWMRIAWRALLCLGLALVIGLECLVISGMGAVPPQGVDYLMILGARVHLDGRPSGTLQRRIDAAAEYLLDNPATIAVASGGQGEDEGMSEAACIRDGLIAKGIAEERILMEDRSTTTAENMAHSMQLMNAGAQTKLGIVSSNYHISRALRLARTVGTDFEAEHIYGLAASEHPFALLHFMMRDGACTLADYLRGNL